jgi:hypothetical protein
MKKLISVFLSVTILIIYFAEQRRSDISRTHFYGLYFLLR